MMEYQNMQFPASETVFPCVHPFPCIATLCHEQAQDCNINMPFPVKFVAISLFN